MEGESVKKKHFDRDFKISTVRWSPRAVTRRSKWSGVWESIPISSIVECGSSVTMARRSFPATVI